MKAKIRSFRRLNLTVSTLESGIDVGQGINVGPGKFVIKNKHRAFVFKMWFFFEMRVHFQCAFIFNEKVSNMGKVS